VERSEPSDAWDEGGDDPFDMSRYGPAPLPAHERSWRHPSEMGQTAWMLTEPPVAIGRGLLITTGAIGCVLGIAVLWLLVPVGGGLPSSAGPTVTSSFNEPRTVVTASIEAPAHTDLLSQTSVAPGPSTITLPSEDVPLNTVLVTRPKQPNSNAVAVAVSTGDHTAFIVTTAHAVSDTEGFSMTGGGNASDGSIVSIDGGLAYLSAPDELDVVGFSETSSAEVGEMVTVLGQEQTPIHFVNSGAVVELDAALVREGTPVIDESGALVALCTLVQGTDGSYVALVPIAPPPATQPTTPTEPTTTVLDSTTTTSTTEPDPTTTTIATLAGWAGIKFGEVDAGAVPTVVALFTGGPAASSGLQAGDQIVAVDSIAVTRVDEVLAAIRAKAPGDTIVFTVITPVSSDPTQSTTSSSVEPAAPAERTISVVLGVYEPAG
jgi:putative serine protease PepD